VAPSTTSPSLSNIGRTGPLPPYPTSIIYVLLLPCMGWTNSTIWVVGVKAGAEGGSSRLMLDRPCAAYILRYIGPLNICKNNPVLPKQYDPFFCLMIRWKRPCGSMTTLRSGELYRCYVGFKVLDAGHCSRVSDERQPFDDLQFSEWGRHLFDELTVREGAHGHCWYEGGEWRTAAAEC
ncbi:arylamine n-acetyltransferase 1, partial [Moniliophthora roreri]